MEQALAIFDVTPIQTLMRPIYDMVLTLHDKSGLPVDQLNFLAMFFLSYPLALIHRQIWNPTIRHIYSALFGILVVIYMVGNEVYHSILSALVVYFILQFVRNPFGTKLIWIWAFGYMSASHLYRMYVDYLGWSVDFTIVQMVFTLKFCAIACNLQDGAFPQGEVSKVQQVKAIKTPPTLLEYFSYLFYWCTILPGPFFEFNEYISFINRSMFKETKGEIPSGSYVAFLKIWVKLVILFAGVFLSFSYSPRFLWKDQAYVDSLNLFARFGLVLVTFPLFRCTYYTGWLMSEAAAILSGFSFNGYDEKTKQAKWDRLNNNDVLGIELGTALKDLIAKWNQGTARFLKFYVYFRIAKRPAREGEDPRTIKGLTAPQGQLVVFVTSAIWHGFYPGYYVFFITIFFCNQIELWISRNITPRVPKQPVAQAIYSVISFFVAMSTLNYGAISFVALSLDNTYIALGNLYWVGHIIVVVMFLVTFIPLPRPRSSRPSSAQDKKRA